LVTGLIDEQAKPERLVISAL